MATVCRAHERRIRTAGRLWHLVSAHAEARRDRAFCTHHRGDASECLYAPATGHFSLPSVGAGDSLDTTDSITVVDRVVYF